MFMGGGGLRVVAGHGDGSFWWGWRVLRCSFVCCAWDGRVVRSWDSVLRLRGGGEWSDEML